MSIKPSPFGRNVPLSCKFASSFCCLANLQDNGTLSLSSFIFSIVAESLMAGLDFADCFWTWLLHPATRRFLGVREPGPSGEDLLCYLFTPFGLSPSPAFNDALVKEVLRVVRSWIVSSGQVRREEVPDDSDFVDDLRFVFPPHISKARAAVIHQALFNAFTRLGIKVHTKSGKFIAPTNRIPFLGFIIDSIALLIMMDPAKTEAICGLIDVVCTAWRKGAQERTRVLRARLVARSTTRTTAAPVPAPPHQTKTGPKPTSNREQQPTPPPRQTFRCHLSSQPLQTFRCLANLQVVSVVLQICKTTERFVEIDEIVLAAHSESEIVSRIQYGIRFHFHYSSGGGIIRPVVQGQGGGIPEDVFA